MEFPLKLDAPLIAAAIPEFKRKLQTALRLPEWQDLLQIV
jgi:hypothetical protein